MQNLDISQIENVSVHRNSSGGEDMSTPYKNGQRRFLLPPIKVTFRSETLANEVYNKARFRKNVTVEFFFDSVVLRDEIRILETAARILYFFGKSPRVITGTATYSETETSYQEETKSFLECDNEFFTLEHMKTDACTCNPMYPGYAPMKGHYLNSINCPCFQIIDITDRTVSRNATE
jgi:hypothetical protein